MYIQIQFTAVLGTISRADRSQDGVPLSPVICAARAMLSRLAAIIKITPLLIHNFVCIFNIALCCRVVIFIRFYYDHYTITQQRSQKLKSTYLSRLKYLKTRVLGGSSTFSPKDGFIYNFQSHTLKKNLQTRVWYVLPLSAFFMYSQLHSGGHFFSKEKNICLTSFFIGAVLTQVHHVIISFSQITFFLIKNHATPQPFTAIIYQKGNT